MVEEKEMLVNGRKEVGQDWRMREGREREKYCGRGRTGKRVKGEGAV